MHGSGRLAGRPGTPRGSDLPRFGALVKVRCCSIATLFPAQPTGCCRSVTGITPPPGSYGVTEGSPDSSGNARIQLSVWSLRDCRMAAAARSTVAAASAGRRRESGTA